MHISHYIWKSAIRERRTGITPSDGTARTGPCRQHGPRRVMPRRGPLPFPVEFAACGAQPPYPRANRWAVPLLVTGSVIEATCLPGSSGTLVA